MRQQCSTVVERASEDGPSQRAPPPLAFALSSPVRPLDPRRRPRGKARANRRRAGIVLDLLSCELPSSLGSRRRSETKRAMSSSEMRVKASLRCKLVRSVLHGSSALFELRSLHSTSEKSQRACAEQVVAGTKWSRRRGSPPALASRHALTRCKRMHSSFESAALGDAVGDAPPRSLLRCAARAGERTEHTAGRSSSPERRYDERPSCLLPHGRQRPSPNSDAEEQTSSPRSLSETTAAPVPASFSCRMMHEGTLFAAASMRERGRDSYDKGAPRLTACAPRASRPRRRPRARATRPRSRPRARAP